MTHGSTAEIVSQSELNSERRNSPWPVVLASSCTIVTFASAFVAIRAGLRAYSPSQLAALRFVVSSLLFGALAIFRPVRVPAARDWPRMILTGLIGFAIYALLINTGEVQVPAGIASFVINTSPVLTAVLASMALGERIGITGWIGLAISLSGTAVLAFGTGTGFAFEPAVLFLLAAALAQAIYFTMQKPLIGLYGATSTISWAVWSAAIFLLPILPSALRNAQRAPLSATLSVIYLAVVPTVIGYATWAFAVSRATVGRLTSLLYFVPPTATLIGWVWLGERPKLIGIGGGCLAIAGVALVNLRSPFRTAAVRERAARAGEGRNR
ncbi:MAG TPA: EamA family transporter [Thermoanaerobaculia bacterium]|nr:EamA family transporter [Thermoanaerobaculia bacterium]